MIRRLLLAGLVGVLAVGTSAHVGSPNAIFEGRAGDYPVRVVVRPPTVIPGLAEVTVRLLDPSLPVERVLVRPVFWRTGPKGSPQGDEAVRVAGPDAVYAGKLWLMTSGAYSIDVEVGGARGTGTVSVPVAGVATAEKSLGAGLTVTLAVLGLILFAGMLSVVRAAAGEGLTPPGQVVDPRARRRARIAVAVAAPVLLMATLGGWRWWQAEAAEYRSTLYRPLDVTADVGQAADTDAAVLTLQVTDANWGPERMTPLIPDHGKIMHMFMIEAERGAAFAHLHPAREDDRTFVTPMPPVPPGRYRVYGDVVHESGFERTLVAITDVPPAIVPGTAALEDDDSWHVVAADQLPASMGSGSPVPAGELVWLREEPSPRSGAETTLRFQLRDAAGTPLAIEPYMGMDGHAVIARDDGSVFIHLHPMGTATMASQQAFALRSRGDTTPEGRLRTRGADAPGEMDHSAHAGHAMSGPTTVSFPYEFPKEGTYRIWVQVKHAGRVQTGRYEVVVP